MDSSKETEWHYRHGYFFIQAEDGIRDYKVTGVQTCALPISEINFYHLGNMSVAAESYLAAVRMQPKGPLSRDALYNALARSEERRVGEERRARWGPKPRQARDGGVAEGEPVGGDHSDVDAVR